MELSGTSRSDDSKNSAVSVDNIVIEDSEIEPVQADGEILNDVKMEVEENSVVFKMINSSDDNLKEEEESIECVEKSNRNKDKNIDCVEKSERLGKDTDEICISREFGGIDTVSGVEHCINYNDTGSEEEENLIKGGTMDDVSGTESMAVDDDVVIVETDVRDMDSDVQISDTGDGVMNFVRKEGDKLCASTGRLASSGSKDSVDELESNRSNNSAQKLTDVKLTHRIVNIKKFPVRQRKRTGQCESDYQQEKKRRMLEEDKCSELKEKTIIKMCFNVSTMYKEVKVILKMEKNSKLEKRLNTLLENSGKAELSQKDREILAKFSKGHNIPFGECSVLLERCDEEHVSKTSDKNSEANLDIDLEMDKDKGENYGDEAEMDTVGNAEENLDVTETGVKKINKADEVIVKTEKEKVETYRMTGIENDKDIIESDLKKEDNKNEKNIEKKVISDLKKGEHFDTELETDINKRNIVGGHESMLLNKRSEVDAVKCCSESGIQNAKIDVGNRCETVCDMQVKEKCMEEDTSGPVGQKAGCDEIKDPNTKAEENSGEKIDPGQVENYMIKDPKCKEKCHESEADSCTDLVFLRSESVVNLLMKVDTIFTTMKSKLIHITLQKQNAPFRGVWANIESKLGRVLEKLQLWVLKTSTMDASVSNTAYRNFLTHILDLIIRVDRIFYENDVWVNLLEYLLGETFVALASLYNLINPILPGFVRNQVKENKGECITFNVNGSNIKFAMDANSLHYLVFVINKFKKIDQRNEEVRQKRIYMFEELAYKEQQKQAENNRKEKEALMQQRKEKELLVMQGVRKQEECACVDCITKTKGGEELAYKEQQKQAENNRKEKEALMQQRREKELLMMQGVRKQEEAFVDYITQTKGDQEKKQTDGSGLNTKKEGDTDLRNDTAEKSKDGDANTKNRSTAKQSKGDAANNKSRSKVFVIKSPAAHNKSSSDVGPCAYKDPSVSPQQSSGSSLGVDSVVGNRHSMEKLKTFLDSKVDVYKFFWCDVPAEHRYIFHTVYRLLQKTKSELYKCFGPVFNDNDSQNCKALMHILSIQGHMLMAFYNRLSVDKQGLGTIDMNILRNLVMLENVELSEQLKNCTTSTSDASSTNSGPSDACLGATVKAEPSFEEEACLPSTSGIALEKGTKQVSVKTEPTSDPATELGGELRSPLPVTTGFVSPLGLPLPASLQPGIVGPFFRFSAPPSATNVGPVQRLNTPPSATIVGPVQRYNTPTSATIVGPVQRLNTPTSATSVGPVQRLNTPTSGVQLVPVQVLNNLNLSFQVVRHQSASTSGPAQDNESKAHVVGRLPSLLAYSNGLIYHIQPSEASTASPIGQSHVGDSTSATLPKIVNYFSLSNEGESEKILLPSFMPAADVPTSVKKIDSSPKPKCKRLPRVQLGKNFSCQMIKSLDNFVQVKFISRSAVREHVGWGIGGKIKMYICRVCNWAFDDRKKFNKHFQTKHTYLGLLAVPDLIMLSDFSKTICGVCGETDDHHVQSHFSKEELEKRYVCTDCTKQKIRLYFETKEGLLKHSWFHDHGEKKGPTICVSCGNIFWHKSSYHLHQILSEQCGLNLAHLHNVENQVPVKLGYIAKSTDKDGVNLVKEQLEILREKKEHLIAMREKLMNKKYRIIWEDT